MVKRITDIVVIGDGSVSRPDDTDGLFVRGGTNASNGANFVLYGSSHPTLPGVSVYEADKLILRSVAGGQTPVVFQPGTVATLPTPTLGGRSFVTDASSPVFGSAVVGGGATAVPVYSDGSTWLVG